MSRTDIRNNIVLNEKTIEEISKRGKSRYEIEKQLRMFQDGFPPVKLVRACTIDDGIVRVDETEKQELIEEHSKAATEGKLTKFIPASGAASRMFKKLQSVLNKEEDLTYEVVKQKAEEGDQSYQGVKEFIDNLKNFAFYDDLKAVLKDDGKDLDKLKESGELRDILDYTLSKKGLNYANLTKGLIKFHRYGGHSRTPIEEHFVEAIDYTLDKNKMANLHFTISPEHEEYFNELVEIVKPKYEIGGVELNVTYSFQKKETDTIAVHPNNVPFRNENGELLFRPGGHGALLHNLDELDARNILIKNVDNVVPDHLKALTYEYKRILTGYLMKLENKTFKFLGEMESSQLPEEKLDEIMDFAEEELFIQKPGNFTKMGGYEKQKFLFNKLNRPIRVCGIVENEGHPGGGPFWVEEEDGEITLQIVEKDQVDMNNTEQKKIFESSTHFNPVDLVCSLKNYQGETFDLFEFRNENTGFISLKSQNGHELKAMELPGLWNGSMAYWNTVFVEVPKETFAPVKEVNVLLNKFHQPR